MRLAHLIAMLFAALLTAPAEAGERFRVTVEGQGPDVILVPGLASSQEVWNATAERLRSTHRVHRVRIAGFAGEPAGGNSGGDVAASVAEDLAAYIAENRLRAPAVIGHSLGGEIALMLAARHPDAVGRVMVVDALPFFSLLIDPAATAETMRPQADRMRDAMMAQSAEQLAAAQPAMIARLMKSASGRPAAIAAALASDRGVTLRAMHELMVTDLRPELGRITAPLTVLYAWDAAFGIPPPAVDGLFRGAYRQAAGARLERIDDSFHFIMVDQPAVFGAAVDRFLGQAR
jgi:pimeloyl-ACP methyl ester carboxylesterase